MYLLNEARNLMDGYCISLNNGARNINANASEL